MNLRNSVPKDFESPEINFELRNSKIPNRYLVYLGIPTTGIIRFEWFVAMQAVVIPVCYSLRSTGRQIRFISPVGLHVAEARNSIVQDFLKSDSEWLFFIDHDVLPHPYVHGYMLEHIRKKEYPIISGLYYAKSTPSLPLVFRGRGAGPFTRWKLGDQVPVDGVPMGMTIIHRSILEYLAKHSQPIKTSSNEIVPEIFHSPRSIFIDPETSKQGSLVGTEDLWVCDRIINEDVLKKTGWKHLSNKKYPFLVDTRLFCKHIDINGVQWPTI